MSNRAAKRIGSILIRAFERTPLPTLFVKLCIPGAKNQIVLVVHRVLIKIAIILARCPAPKVRNRRSKCGPSHLTFGGYANNNQSWFPFSAPKNFSIGKNVTKSSRRMEYGSVPIDVVLVRKAPQRRQYPILEVEAVIIADWSGEHDVFATFLLHKDNVSYLLVWHLCSPRTTEYHSAHLCKNTRLCTTSCTSDRSP